DAPPDAASSRDGCWKWPAMCPGSRAWSRGFLIDAPVCLSQDRARSSMPTRAPATLPLLPTTVVGSFPEREGLVDREALLSGGVPRVPRGTLWRVPAELRDQAHDDAVRLTVQDLERAGIDILSDGEVRRESYFNWLAPALTGLDVGKPGRAVSRGGGPAPRARARGPR